MSPTLGITLGAKSIDDAADKSGESSANSRSESNKNSVGTSPNAKEQIKASRAANNDTSDAEITIVGSNYNIIDIPPGTVGIAVTVVKSCGALIANIYPSCPFKDKIQIGDVIASIDGKKVVSLEDFHPGKDRLRKFGIMKKNMMEASSPAKRKRGEGEDHTGHGAAGRARKQRKNYRTVTATVENTNPMMQHGGFGHLLAQQHSNQTNELSKYFQTCHGADGWEYRCRQLLHYKMCHDDDCSSVPLNYIAPDDLTLGQWADQQRKLYRDNGLAPERALYLQSQGFNFDYIPKRLVGIHKGAATGDKELVETSKKLVSIDDLISERTLYLQSKGFNFDIPKRPLGVPRGVATRHEQLVEKPKELIQHRNDPNGDENTPIVRQGLHSVDSKPAELSKKVGSLQRLWEEFKVGLDGRKPAEQFSNDERNVNYSMKCKYYRRNNVWQCIKGLVDSGLTAEVAIDRIHKVYGYDSNPNIIIDQIVADKKKYHGGFHPDLYRPEQTAGGRAELCPNPRTLQVLWEEYKVGLDGRKPAEQFTQNERNANYTTQKRYDRRINVWQCIKQLVDVGLAAEIAIDRIHKVYGYDSTPRVIIDQIIADKKTYGGFHPGLHQPTAEL